MTQRTIFVVSSNAVTGRDDEYNEWYTERHLDETLRVPGVVSAQRFRLHEHQMAGREPSAYQYLAIYECEGDVSAILAEFERRRRTGELTYSPAYDTGGHPTDKTPDGLSPRPTGFFYAELTPKRTAPADGGPAGRD
jgi:hypothetical protein